MKKGDLVMDADERLGVVVTIVLAYVPVKECVTQGAASVAMVFFFENQEQEIVYADEITVIKKGEFDGTHILE